MGKIVVVIGCWKSETDLGSLILGLKRDNPKIKRAGYILSNTRGNTEIYLEFASEDIAKGFAIGVQCTPAPIRGLLMDVDFDEIISSSSFQMMGGTLV